MQQPITITSDMRKVAGFASIKDMRAHIEQVQCAKRKLSEAVEKNVPAHIHRMCVRINKKRLDIKNKYRNKKLRHDVAIQSSYYPVCLDYGKHGSFAVCVCRHTSTPVIDIDITKDFDGYSKACRYPMIRRDIVLYLPDKKGYRHIANPSELDGCDNVLSARRIGASNTYECLIIQKGRGIDYNVAACYIAVEQGITYHADTKQEARKGLARKLKRLASKTRNCIGKTITREQFAKLTGACRMGIEQFCHTHNISNECEVSNLIHILPKIYQKIIIKAYNNNNNGS